MFFYVPFALLFALLRGLDVDAAALAWGGGALVVLALVFTAIGFWEFQTRHLLLNPKVIASNQVEEYFRVNSLFFDPNIYGRFLALVMIGLASVLLWAKRPRIAGADDRRARGALGRADHDALAVELRRAAARPGGAGLAALRRQGRRRGRRSCAVVVGAVLVLRVPGARCGWTSATPSSLDDATSGRFDLMEGGVDLAREKPLLGWGSGSFNAEYRAHETQLRAARRRRPRTRSRSRSRPSRGSSGSRPTSRCSSLAFVRLLRGARGSRCGRRSPPASPRSCCTRGSTPPSSRTR